MTMRAQFGKGLARYGSGFFLAYSAYLLLVTPSAWTNAEELIGLFLSALVVGLLLGLCLLGTLSPREISWDGDGIRFTGWFSGKKEFAWETLELAASTLHPTVFAKLKFSGKGAISIFMVAYRPEDWIAFSTALRQRFNPSTDGEA